MNVQGQVNKVQEIMELVSGLFFEENTDDNTKTKLINVYGELVKIKRYLNLKIGG